LGNTISILKCLEQRWNIMFNSRDFLPWNIIQLMTFDEVNIMFHELINPCIYRN
jgi:hypothetical protein